MKLRNRGRRAGMTHHDHDDSLAPGELEAVESEQLPAREVMSTLPYPDDGFVFIEPIETEDPPPIEKTTKDGGEIDW
jgi:hypothetical protein